MRLTITLSSALLALALATPASAQTAAPGNQGKFCLQGSGTDAKTNCTFQTMAACEKAKQGSAQQCVENKATTTGAGGMNDKKQ